MINTEKKRLLLEMKNSVRFSDEVMKE